MITAGEIKDPRIDTLVRITGAEVSRDLEHAKVFVSFYGDQEKTRLMIELGRRAEASGTLVLMGECLPRGARPLQALHKPLRRVAAGACGFVDNASALPTTSTSKTGTTEADN